MGEQFCSIRSDGDKHLIVSNRSGNALGSFDDREHAEAALTRLNYHTTEFFLPAGPFVSVLERTAAIVEGEGYTKSEATAIARVALAKPLPEELLNLSADILADQLPPAATILENQWDALAQKVAWAAQVSPLFVAPNGSCWLRCAGVYPPGNQQLGVVVMSEDTQTGTEGAALAADWEMDSNGDIVFSKVRDVSINFQNFLTQKQFLMSEAIVVLDAVRSNLADAETAYLAACANETSFRVPAMTLEGQQPLTILELAKYQTRAGVLTEQSREAIQLPEVLFEGSHAKRHAIVSMATRHSAVRAAQKRAIKSQVNLIRPVLGQPMVVGGIGTYEKAAKNIQSLIFDKKIFTLSEARKWLRRLDFSSKEIDESPVDVIRAPQYGYSSKRMSQAKVSLVRGVSAIVCARS